jgi:hypothetical protein
MNCRRQIETLKRHDWGFNRARTKVLATQNSNENHPYKKITRKRKKLEKTLLEVAFDPSQTLCVCFGGLKGVFIEFRNNP